MSDRQAELKVHAETCRREALLAMQKAEAATTEEHRTESLRLVPLHRGNDGLEFGQVFGLDEQLDASRDAWLASDQFPSFERQHHLVDGRRADCEEALHVGFGGRAPHHQSVGMNEGQILTLLAGEAWFWGRGIHVT
jgi:hypothetical protein